jgi:nitrogen regulatory protein P-II 1
MSETLLTKSKAATAVKLEIIIKPGKLDAVKKALTAAGYSGLTVSQAEGHGNQKGLSQTGAGGSFRLELLPKMRVEVVIAESDLEPTIQAVSKAAQTGQPGDGKIFVTELRDVIRIRTGERGGDAV